MYFVWSLSGRYVSVKYASVIFCNCHANAGVLNFVIVGFSWDFNVNCVLEMYQSARMCLENRKIFLFDISKNTDVNIFK